MNITVPVYVEEQAPQPTEIGHKRLVALRPLFFDHPREQDENLQRASVRLTRELRRELANLARHARHEELAAYCFNPQVEEQILKLTLEIGKTHFPVRHLFVLLPAFGRRLAWTPSVPDIWFEVARGESLQDRALEVLTEHYKILQRRQGRDAVRPDATSIAGKAWLTSLELSLDIPGVYSPPAQTFFAILNAGELQDGATELERVGRSLNALYPDELERAHNREDEIAEVTKLLGAGDKRPVLLVGRRWVGKTAIIHEFVRRRMARRRSSELTLHATPQGSIADLAGDVWLIAPQRLISGMSYVGQWEGRLLAILKEAERKRHTLYFADVIGLFYAGKSSGSQLNVAHVLRPYVERRDVRVLAEMTPEALRVLRELDRSFADLFQIVPIKELNEEENLRTLLGYRRALEQQHNCRFHAEVLPTVIDLTRRYVSDAAFPGKAAAQLQTLATKHKNADIGRETALREFSSRSGLSVRFLDDRSEFNHAEVVEALSREVIGQQAAVAACADAVTIAKARLNDTGRPIASFLFLGPTGVGKTQCAKSLAKYLFGDTERILRFDMNEFASQYSAARLTGTIDAPEGLLTGALRREPFAVVLFDEIEKAHPAVFDLLLGVLDDARLTDARGHTVNFTNTIIILTSNLGAREAASELGFRQTNQSDASVYRQAAEKFFKPEFFNRLTRVVPFERLRREDVRQIAQGLVAGLFSREGLVRRGVKLIVSAEALNLLVDAGYHPQLGARALKRTLERQVASPLAARLAAAASDRPLIIFLHDLKGRLTVEVSHLRVISDATTSARRVPFANPSDLLDRVEDALARIEEEATELRVPGEIIIGGSAANVSAQLQHFFLRDQARRVARMLDRGDERLARESNLSSRRDTRLNAPKRRSRSSSSAAARANKRQLAKLPKASGEDTAPDYLVPPFDDTLFGRNLARTLADCLAHSLPYGDELADYLQDILRETALLEALWTTRDGYRETENASHDLKSAAADHSGKKTLLTIASLDDQGRQSSVFLRDLYQKLFEKEFGFNLVKSGNLAAEKRKKAAPHQSTETLIIDSPLAALIAPLEAGTHLFVSESESYIPVIVRAVSFMTELAGVEPEAMALPPVVRIYSDTGQALDLRSRLLAPVRVGTAELRAFILAALRLPQEFD